VLQGRAFLRNQRDMILFHRSAPSLDVHPASECSQETGACPTRQLEIDWSSMREVHSRSLASVFKRHLPKLPVNRRLTRH
jgi:hypothetical protein